MAEDTITPGEPRRLSTGWRAALSSLMVIVAAASIAYRALVTGHIEQTAALFVGLPLLIGFLATHLTRARSAYGQVIRANVIFLAVAAPLLGEGSICLLMAAPLFIGVSMIGVAMYQSIRSRAVYAILALPLAAGWLQKKTGSFPPEPQSVRTRWEVSGSAAGWRKAVREAAPVAQNGSRFLALGFPLPLSYTMSGDGAEVRFARAEGVTGHWRVRCLPFATGVRFELIEDTTRIAHWMEMKESAVEVEESAGKVAVIQTTRFVPLLSPFWYFVPAQRFAVREAHRLALESWRMAVR